MKIGFKPCGLTTQQAIDKLIALGGIYGNGYDKSSTETDLYWYIDSVDNRIHCHESHLDVVLDPNKIPEKINKISNLPSEIIQLLVQRQVEAGNRGSVKVFDNCPTADKFKGGFTWDKTPEGGNFWDDFFAGKYYLYYTLNCKHNETKLQNKTTSIGRSKNITGSGIRCERRKPTIASRHLGDRKAIVF